MDVTSTSQTTTTSTSTAEETTGGELSGDLDTFLLLLTAQIENQDPLEPMDSTDFVAQLATFSSVEQQTETNDWLDQISGQLGSMGMAEFAGWVGMEARVAAPAYFDGEPITVSPNPVAIADTMSLIVRDENGTEVDRVALPVSTDLFEWDGVGHSGETVPDGVYSFTLESSSNGEVLAEDTAEIYGLVTEVQGEEGTTVMVMEGDVRVDVNMITAVRNPEEPV